MIKTRKNLIEDALASVYSSDGKPRGQVEWLAIDLDSKWDNFKERSEDEKRQFGDSPEETFQYLVHMLIWNWYSGGGTAEIAAKKVIAAVQEQEVA